MFHALWTLRNAILAAALLVMAASPAFAQRLYRGGYEGAGGTYYPGNADPNISNYYTPAANDPTATIAVRVPANAKVWFDDAPTRSTGTQRLYYSPPLESGKTYHYTVRAEWEDNGKTVKKSQDVEVRAGKRADVNFTATAP
jgi:uncharacterized protein (TIGR03000 family)